MEKATAKSAASQTAKPYKVQASTLPAVQTSAQAAAGPQMKTMCESHIHRYVEVRAVDGQCYDGIVEHVDDNWLCLAVPGSIEPMRAFGPGPFFSPFGGGFGGPFYPYRPRRFNRLVLPLAALTAISLLPYYW